MYNFKLKPGLLLLPLTFAACSMQPKVVEFSTSANPEIELEAVGVNIQNAKNQQVDMLAPKNFYEASKARDKAVEARSTNKSQSDVLHNIALSQAYLDRANSYANISNQILESSVAARKGALNADAMILFPKEMEAEDKKLKDVTAQVEKNNMKEAEHERNEIEAVYKKIELNSIIKNKLGSAEEKILQARKEGAAKLTPQTLSWADQRYKIDQASVVTNIHDDYQMNKARDDANASAERLLKMVRNAKSITGNKPEEVAQKMERSDLSLAQSDSLLSESQQNFKKANNDLDNVNNDLALSEDQRLLREKQNKNLESSVRIDREFEKARSQFTEKEADVYKQGDKLLLRLKGLSFDNNRSAIKAANYKLLAKVQKVITAVDAKKVAIEGHSDSIGGKKLHEQLSEKRAESVQSYFISNNDVVPDRITAAGYGYSKPIATNKTAAGRAQNRRVDIIITAGSDQQE